MNALPGGIPPQRLAGLLPKGLWPLGRLGAGQAKRHWGTATIAICLLTLLLACGCGQHGGKGAQAKGTKTQETRDPALIALSSASVEVNRRHLAKAMNQSANSRASAKGKPSKASANKAADIPSALVTRLSPKSELMTPYRMDFGWEGKATDALMTLSKALGWEYECDPGTGLGLIRIPESPGGTSLFGLLVEINLRLLPMGEEIEADEILRKLRLRRLRRTN